MGFIKWYGLGESYRWSLLMVWLQNVFCLLTISHYGTDRLRESGVLKGSANRNWSSLWKNLFLNGPVIWMTWWKTTQSGNFVSPAHENSCLFWTVSVLVKGTAGFVERLGALQTLICAPVVRPKRCPTSSNPVLLPSWVVVCPSFTLLMMLLLPGWPTMGLNRIRYARRRRWWITDLCTVYRRVYDDVCMMTLSLTV